MRGQNSLQSEEQIRFWCPNQGGRGGFLLEKAPAGNVAEQGREAMSKGDGGPWGQGSPTHSESPNNCSSSLDSVLSRTWTHWIQLTLWFNPTASELVGIKKKKKKKALIWGSRKIFFHGYWKFLDFSWTWFKSIWICTQNSTSHLMALEPLRSILLFYDSNNPKACLLSITWCQLLRWAQVHLIHALATGCHELLESQSCYH